MIPIMIPIMIQMKMIQMKTYFPQIGTVFYDDMGNTGDTKTTLATFIRWVHLIAPTGGTPPRYCDDLDQRLFSLKKPTDNPGPLYIRCNRCITVASVKSVNPLYTVVTVVPLNPLYDTPLYSIYLYLVKWFIRSARI